ncbi:MAG: FapA family protein [Lachnospiraceae bacterium]|nr:FapA family protein [Lachnospiraceae bacterium]
MNADMKKTNVKKLNEYDYVQELDHIRILGGDADKYQGQGMDYAQLVEIRRGLEKGFDVSIYDKPNIPWFQMEEIRDALEEGIDLKEYFESGYDWMQLSEIRLGMEHKVDITCYAKKTYIAQQMKEIRIGLENGVDVSRYADVENDWFQMEEIRKGLERNGDIEAYTGKGYDYLTMREIRKAQEKGIDLQPYVKKGYPSSLLLQIRRCINNQIIPDPYLDEGYDAEQLEQILIAHQKQVDINPYLSSEMVGPQLEQIIKGLEDRVDVTKYARSDFGWQQMREIRRGLEDRIDVSAYLKTFYNWQQMREIRLGLEAGYDVSSYAKLRYSVTDMRNFREKLMEVESEPSETFSTPDNLVEESVTSFVTISEDGMEADLNLARPKKNKAYTEKDILELLKENGVTLGIDKEVVRLIVEQEIYEEKVVVARGQKAIPGEDGHYEFYFRTQLPTLPKILEDGSVDYMNMDYFEKAIRGQKLAYYFPATLGKGGYTVNGKIMVARKGIEQPVLRGTGFVLLEDKRTYVATLSGKVSLAENYMEVSKLHIVDGDVTYTTGNITFDGDLIVHGCVRSGVTLQAKGNIEIDGNVESANLIAEGDILVKQGVQAGGMGMIHARGAVTGRFFESVIIETEGDIRANYILNCDITTKGKVVVSGKKGILVGGRTRAVQGADVYEIGNNAQLSTVIEAGLTRRFFEKYNEIQKNLIKIRSEVEVFREGIRKFENTYKKEQLAKISVYDKIKLAHQMKLEELEEGKIRKEAFEKEMEEMSNAKITAKGRAYPGVYVIIDRIPLRLMESVENVTFKHIEDRVGIFRNNKGEARKGSI